MPEADRSLPARTLAAALLMGAARWAIARSVAGVLASVAAPDFFARFVWPAKFD